MREVGVRELRSDLAAAVRRAAAGESVAITVSGRVAAVLAPPTAAGASGVDLLVASGALVPPRRDDRHVPDRPTQVWGNVRLDRLLREIRG